MALGALLGLAACATTGAPSVQLSSDSPTPEVSEPAASLVKATPEATAMPSAGPFTLTSDAFAEGGAIPRDYSCQGNDISPALAWSGTPAGTAQLVLVVDDPDAGGFIHWIALIGGDEVAIPRGISPTAATPQQGVNGFGDVGWGGPCPPSGTHHYRFSFTAVAAPSGLTGNPTIAQVRAALAIATIIGTTTLTGTYQKT